MDNEKFLELLNGKVDKLTERVNGLEVKIGQIQAKTTAYVSVAVIAIQIGFKFMAQ